MVKHLEFRILVDNTSQTVLQTEHGFAVWVECDDKLLLILVCYPQALTEKRWHKLVSI